MFILPMLKLNAGIVLSYMYGFPGLSGNLFAALVYDCVTLSMMVKLDSADTLCLLHLCYAINTISMCIL